jgi:transposase InsO family protein
MRLRTDSGGEYDSKEFKGYLESKGIKHEKTNAYTPQENGISKRMNHTLVESARAMLNDSRLPDSYWKDAIEYAVEIKNVVPTHALSNLTPHKAYTGNLLDVS